MTTGYRDYNNYPTTVVRSLAQGQKVVHKFGKHASIGNTVEDIWNVTSKFITFPTSAFPVVAISSSANDDAGGTGARAITIEGLDPDFIERSEDLIMNGAALTLQTSTSFIRINRVFVKESGIYSNTASGPNAGNITIQYSGSTGLQSILAGSPAIGQTQNTLFTVPTGFTGYIQKVTGNVDSAKTATIYAWQRQDADVVIAPFTAKRNLFTLNGVSGVNPLDNVFPMGPYPEKTDLWCSAVAGAAGTAVEVDYEILLIPN